MNTKLAVSGLSLSYGDVQILRDVDVTLREGEVVVLLGPSGSGKTTLLRALAGFATPSHGRIAIDGKPIFDAQNRVNLPAETRDLGFVFQSYALWPHRTVGENVGYPLKLRRTPEAQRRERVGSVLRGLGLEKLIDRYPSQLSGGQQQRVAIARALIYDPPVILLDEPLSNLDAKLRDEAKAWLRRLIKERNLSAIMVTHDQDEAMAMADRIVLLSGGAVEQQGTAQEVYFEPRSRLTAEFFGRNNLVEGVVTALDGKRATIEAGPVTLVGTAREPVAIGEKVHGVIRVEDTGIGTPAAPDTIPAALGASMFGGSHWQHRFDLGPHSFRVDTRSQDPGPMTHLHVPSDKLWLWRQ